MKVDAPLVTAGLDQVATAALEIERSGYDGVYTFEGPHDPFLPLVLAAEHTERVELMTAIAIAFARSPMTLAQLSWDLQSLSRGRAILGLGSQIKPHIERRFSMPWSAPAARMREFVLAIRAIWTTWQERTALDFRGTFYSHTLMTPFFDPGPNPHGLPRIFIAGVGPAMTAVAGEVGDGFLVHPFSTERFLREHTIPALHEGLDRAGKTHDGFEIAWPIMTVTGNTEEQFELATAATRAQIAFYASTPAYSVVLAAHGWEALQPELNRLSKEGRWTEMADLIPDDLLDTFAVRGTPEQLPDLIRDRTRGLVDRVAFNAPYQSDPAIWQRVLDELTA